MAVTRRWYVAGAAAVVLAAVLSVAVVLAGPAAPTAMQVVVSPHPDDELQGWTVISRAEQTFTTFVVMTGGEATGHCNGAPNLQEEWGERAPEPLPGPADQGTEVCAAARIDSWHDFLDRAADTLPGGERRRDMDRTELPTTGATGEPAQLWVGRSTARVALDAGDGDLAAAEVEQAVRALLDLRGEELPDLPVAHIVATAYFNDSPAAGANRRADGCRETPCDGDSRALEYEHRDHAAVNDAVRSLAPLARDGAWLVTHPHDPHADHRMALDQETYAELMGLGDRLGPQPGSFERRGAHQVSYGWLAFPGSYWPTGRIATSRNGVLFPRVQFFRHVQGAS